jgi:hypothetical protein
MPKASQPFLGSTAVSFAEAFSNIGAFSIEVRQGDLIWGSANALGATGQFTQDHPPPPTVPCINRLCSGGGLDLQTYLQQANGSLPWSLEQTFRCGGHEGSQGRSCFNAFRVQMRFEPKLPSVD